LKPADRKITTQSRYGFSLGRKKCGAGKKHAVGMQLENMVYRMPVWKYFVAKIFRCVLKNRQKTSVVTEKYTDK